MAFIKILSCNLITKNCVVTRGGIEDCPAVDWLTMNSFGAHNQVKNLQKYNLK